MGKVIQMKGWQSRKDKRTKIMSKLTEFLKKADHFFALANERREEVNDRTRKPTE